MTLTIPDEVLNDARLSESQMLIEIACRLFDVGHLSMSAASRLAKLDRPEFERELFIRKIPAYRPTVADLESDLKALDRLGI